MSTTETEEAIEAITNALATTEDTATPAPNPFKVCLFMHHQDSLADIKAFIAHEIELCQQLRGYDIKANIIEVLQRVSTHLAKYEEMPPNGLLISVDSGGDELFTPAEPFDERYYTVATEVDLPEKLGEKIKSLKETTLSL